MTRTKGVMGMKMIGLAVVALVLTAGGGWGMGERPRRTSTTTWIAGTGITSSGTDREAVHNGVRAEGRIRFGQRIRESSPGVEYAEFLDDRGAVKRSIRLDGVKVMAVIPCETGDCVVVVEATENIRHMSSPWYMVRYYRDGGHEVWSAPICCNLGDIVESQAKVSGNGAVVALLDSAEGETCEVGEDGFEAPPGCAGLRVFTAEGKEILREKDGKRVEISPSGKYALFEAGEGQRWWVLHTKSGAKREIEKPVGVRPGLVDDDGVVLYTERKGYPKYRNSPTKGLEKLKD